MMQPGDTAVARLDTQPGEILQEFERRIGSRTFNLWVRDNASIEIADDQVTVNVHNKFLLSWLQQRYRPAMLQAAQLVVGDAVAVQFRELPPPPPPLLVQAISTAPQIEATSGAARPSTEPTREWAQSERRDGGVRSPMLRGFGGRGKDSATATSALAALPIAKIALSCARRENSQSGQDFQVGRRGTESSDDDAYSAAAGHDRTSADRPPLPPNAPKGSLPAANQQPSGSQAASQTSSAPRSGRRFSDLNDFIAGPANQLALTAALQVCEQPGGYNPLVLHGGVGIGKTHLLEGIYRRMRARYPSFRVVFLSAESFANYFTQALRDRTLASFRQRFRGVDVLMIDDVDFLDGKRVIQEEFLHTIRQLESHGRQVALTADRHPRLLTRLSEELVTRFMSGIVCRLESPDVDTRRTIVARKAARLTVRITDEAIEFVVQRFALSVRELEGALNFLENYGQATGKTINLAVARTVLADLDRDCTRIVRVAEVEQAVCRLFSLGPNELRSPRRNRTVSQPRMLAMYLARKMTQAAYTEIGEHFGGRNHSTVMSAEKRVRTLLEADATVRAGSQEWKLGDLLASLEQQLLTG
jgi:chromosomal replication initiator protein